MADGERVMANALAGVEGMLRRLNLSRQQLTVQVYADKPHPTRSHLLPFGPTATPPAEAYRVGWLLRQFDDDRLLHFLSNALRTSVSPSPRTDRHCFSGGYCYFFSIASKLALGENTPAEGRGRWAAIALGCASLLRWVGNVQHALGDSLRDVRWRGRFGDSTAALAEDIADGAVGVGSRDLLHAMRSLSARDAKPKNIAPGRRGRKPSSTSHHAVVTKITERERGEQMYLDEIAEASSLLREVPLTDKQVWKAKGRVPGATWGDDNGRRWIKVDG